MRKSSFNIESFDNLKDFFSEYDKNVLLLKKNHELLEPLLNYKEKTDSDDEKQKLQWEVEANLFDFYGGRLFSFSTSNGKEVGEISEYPQLNEYQNTAFDYLKNRAINSQSTYLKARYNLLLWHSNGLNVWYDEFTLRVGDSLRRSIDHGLNNSRYGIVVLSEAFFNKEWPKRELDGLFAREVNGEKVILPIWHKISKNEVLKFSPIIADMLALNTASFTIEEIAKEISNRVLN
ncbi:MAG: toll/interleukin-1 receptor domain-containing protein [Bacteroidia bacterium]